MLTADILKHEKRELEKQLAVIEPMRKRLALIAELLKLYDPLGDSTQAAAQPFFEPLQQPTQQSGAFSGMGPTEGVIKILEGRPTEFFTPVEIANELKKGGVNTSSPNISTMVANICKVKAKKGKFEEAQKNGRKAFRIKL